ncbi:hypothetical protein Mesil_3441 (plasmid) [Allomeiothermus silvanus DSM 9946]|uniref:Uncharacterized protein n=1 Tax=Allomeiothermus silvanus (strain ATCC 700542 / DSM 9946 / NBRC 106475 / NCIMB 13440 / VI-R2) TaxID=526227 RepID=D7BIM2_ALLS1|nr:hypothetical protein [Allomeiothermus silvanus]ADH65028.1 hypothetical protein Mesil_3206 [Allomeiothermus silvanus DSM 9946]ADH65249.1 hypothetical protein Mesil_3441 [Allomeiothermus silvanus DSM 9946]
MKTYAILSGLLAFFLAACGGGTPPPPSSITLTVEDPMGSFNAAAYQVGSGSWQSLNMSGTVTKTGTFSLGSQSKYGVAVRCGGLKVKVIQATSVELSNPKVTCSQTTPSPVSFSVTVAVAPALFSPGDWVCLNGASCQPAATSVTLSPTLQSGPQDLVLTLRDSSFTSVKAAKVVRNVNVTNGGNTSASLTLSDQLPPVSFTLPTSPSGYAPPSVAILYRATGGSFADVSIPPSAYRPVSGYASGDLYYAEVNASTGSTGFLTHSQLFTSTPSLSLPAPWPTGSLSVSQQAHPIVSGLSRTDSDLRGYQMYLQIPAQIYYTATVSKGWLSGPSYTLPDLSATGLLGYTPPSGSGSFSVSALLSNTPLLSLDPSNPGLLSAGDYAQEATAQITNYTVGGGTVTLP